MSDLPPQVRGLIETPRTRTPLSDITRALPYSDDAEQGVLSCFFQNPVDLLADARETLPNEAFYHPTNRALYDELLLFSSTTKGHTLDLVTFSQYLIDKGIMDKIGGPGFIAELLSFVPTFAHYPYYKGILRDKLQLRRMIGACTEGIQLCYEYQEDVAGLVDRVEAAIMGAKLPDKGDIDDDFGVALDLTTNAIQAQKARGGMLAGLSTGLSWLDELTGGFIPGVYYIGARPSMGKTALLLQLIEELAVIQKLPVGFFSLEMSKERLIRRLLSRVGWIPLSILRTGRLEDEHWKKLARAYDILVKANIRIDDRAGMTLAQVRHKARIWKRKHDIKALFLDYLQRMSPNDPKLIAHPTLAHAGNSTGLTDLAKELGIPLIIAAQLNRESEKRPGKRPQLSDFEGCGRIEQDGDVIMLMSAGKGDPESEHDRHVLLDIAKQRDGATDEATHLFRSLFMRFDPDPVVFPELGSK